MHRIFSCLAVLALVAGCPGSPEPAEHQEIPASAPYARVVPAEAPGSFDVRFGHLEELTSFGLVVHVEGGTIASWERDDSALVQGGGRVLPLRAKATDTELELLVGITKPVTITDEASVAHLEVTPHGDLDDVHVTLELSGDNRGAISRAGNAFDLQNLTAALN